MPRLPLGALVYDHLNLLNFKDNVRFIKLSILAVNSLAEASWLKKKSVKKVKAVI